MTRADRVIDGWKQLYVSGTWTLGEFEAHVEAMLPTIPPEWYAPEPERTRGGRTAKDAAEKWSAAASAASANWTAALSSGRWLVPVANAPVHPRAPQPERGAAA